MILLWVAICQTMAQPHLSNVFELEGEWIVDHDNRVFQPQGMVGCVEDGILFCCHRRGFQSKESNFHATVCAINLSTGQEIDYFVPFPEKKASPSASHKYWIRNILTEGNKLFMATQNSVLLYKKGKGNRYEFVGRLPMDLPDCLFIKNGKLAAVERVPEEGRFILKQQGEHGNTLDSAMALQLPGPFMLQYEPNGFVKQSGKALYFLASPELRVEKYSTNGELLSVICPELPYWRAIPDEMVRRISDMPYGSDRAMYTFFHTKEYSFPLAVHPLGDSLLMLSYHQYDTLEKKEEVLTALVRYGKKGDILRMEPYSHFFEEDSVIGEKMFPLYFAQRELCLQVVDDERIVQVVREAPIEWRGKTGHGYNDSVEQYFANGTPEFRVRVAKLRTGAAERRISIRDLGLRTYNGCPVTDTELLSPKVIFIVNNPPQCHNCEESICSFVSTLDTGACKVCVVFNNADGYMSKRDQMESIRKHLTVPFMPLFIPTESKESVLKLLNAGVFPVILMKEASEREAILIPNELIFSENLTTSEIRQTFVNKIRQFLYREGGVGK